jgi:hypothetical protein
MKVILKIKRCKKGEQIKSFFMDNGFDCSMLYVSDDSMVEMVMGGRRFKGFTEIISVIDILKTKKTIETIYRFINGHPMKILEKRAAILDIRKRHIKYG